MSTPEPRVRVRRERSASESLLSIVLLLEGFLVFFVALAAFSLRVVTPVSYTHLTLPTNREV